MATSTLADPTVGKEYIVMTAWRESQESRCNFLSGIVRIAGEDHLVELACLLPAPEWRVR